MNGHPWTKEQIEIVRTRYPHTHTTDLVGVVGHPVHSIYDQAAKLGLRKSPEFLASAEAGRLTANIGIGSRFQKGHKTWNAGMKGLRIGGEKTQFKYGNVPRNHLPVGSVIIRTDGYSKTKIADPNVWVLTHRLVWAQAGNKPPVHPQVIRFKDGNQLNCAIENLELSTKKTIMAANSVQVLPENLRKVIQLQGVLRRKLNGK